MDLSHVYGDNLEKQHKLRLFKDGKLRYQVHVESESASPYHFFQITQMSHIYLHVIADAGWGDVPSDSK